MNRGSVCFESESDDTRRFSSAFSRRLRTEFEYFTCDVFAADCAQTQSTATQSEYTDVDCREPLTYYALEQRLRLSDPMTSNARIVQSHDRFQSPPPTHTATPPRSAIRDPSRVSSEGYFRAPRLNRFLMNINDSLP
jgi:hypothetical protein